MAGKRLSSPLLASRLGPLLSALVAISQVGLPRTNRLTCSRGRLDDLGLDWPCAPSGSWLSPSSSLAADLTGARLLPAWRDTASAGCAPYTDTWLSPCPVSGNWPVVAMQALVLRHWLIAVLPSKQAIPARRPASSQSSDQPLSWGALTVGL